MRQNNRRAVSSTLAIALAAGTVSVAAPSALANPQGTNVVINEVYGGGGNSGAKYTHDFVELYNPTERDIDLTGWVLDQQSTAGNSGSKVALRGVVPAGGYFLIQGKAGDTGSGESLPAPDQEAGFEFGAKGAIAVLLNGNNEIDRVGWGGTSKAEGKAAGGTGNGTSVQRKQVGVDTDNNAADFEVAEPTPQGSGQEQNSGNEGSTDNPADPQPQPQPGEVSIADIQGTGPKSPLEGKTVTTEGVVTAVYDEGGKKGFFLQTGGSGSEKQPGDASDGIFVYMGSQTNYPQRGDSVRVSGKVSEYFNQTQITVTSISKLDTALEAPKAVKIDTLPAGDEAREPYEGMLVHPKGPYTVTNNYTLNNTGDLGLAPGERAHRTPTDVVSPGDGAKALQAKQDAEVVYLDDGRTANYFRTDKNTPLPYIVTSDNGIKSIRTGDRVDFQTDVVVDYSFDQWRFQPLQPITGKNAAEELPIQWEDSREASYDVPGTVKGDYSIGFFNVLNYFTSLGKDEQGCKAYNDINGHPVAANNCKVRGAFSRDAFEDQQAKIVTAINKLDTSVLGLSEIENTATVTSNVAQRDEALSKLVEALNNAGGNWDYVKSPQKLGTDEDFIRVAFIYNKDKVEPVGESVIFDDPAFTRTARQPLAQEFNTLGDNEDKNFVAVVNHFKSKGSVAKGDADTGDGQGNNARIRTEQSAALLTNLGKQSKWAELPTFLVGDFNAYTKEDAITKLVEGGFSIVESEKDYDQASYQFDGQLGTLDHVLANAAAKELIQDSAVWNINGDESVAFEYSRRKYNVQDFFGQGDDKLYGYGNPFRSSDHDPVKVGFNTAKKTEEEKTDAEKYDPQAGDALTVEQGAALPDAKTAVKNADALPEGTRFAWSDKATNAEGTTTRTVTVTYPDNTTDKVEVKVTVTAKPEESKPRYIAKTEINEEGELVVTYDNGETENLGKVTGATGEQGQTGADGRGISKTEINEDGELVVTYTDGTIGYLGKVKGTEGSAGRGIFKTEIDANGDLIITYTDGTTQNAGKVQTAAPQTPSTGSSGSSVGSSTGGVLGILLGILAAIAAGVGALYYFMPDAVNAQLKQWGLH